MTSLHFVGASRRRVATLALLALGASRLVSDPASASFPSDYRGSPFDDRAYRAQQAAEADLPKQPFRTFAPAIIWVTPPKDNGRWSAAEEPAAKLSLGDAEKTGRQTMRFHASLANYRYTDFVWHWDEPVALKGFDAVSFSIKVTGDKRPQEIFFSFGGAQAVPVSLRDFDPDFTDGYWHTLTIPLRSFKTNDGAAAEPQVRDFVFKTFVWDPADFDVELDHFSFDRAIVPLPPLSPGVRTAEAKPQAIPGRLETAFYDLGGEGVAYHDTTPINILSGVLNQQRRHQRGHATPYHWNFRRDEGVDISFTKDWADLNHPNLVDPPTNQLYIGGTEDGEWCNYTVTVAKAGTYRIVAAYGNDANGKTFSFDLNHVPACVCTAPVVTGNMHHWNRAEVGTITFPSSGKFLLTLRYGRGFNLGYFDFLPLP